MSKTKTFELPITLTRRATITIEAKNIDEAHDKFVELGVEAIDNEASHDHEAEITIDWDAYQDMAGTDESEDE